MHWIDVLIAHNAVFFLMGVAVGVLSGLLGIGGGIVLVPMLHAVLLARGLTPALAFHTALATAMACIVFTALSNMHAHQQRGNIVWSYVWAMLPMVSLGALAATWLAIQVPASLLKLIFALFLLVAARQLWHVQATKTAHPPSRLELRAVSLWIGMVSALVSIGGGTLTVPYLTLRNVPVKQAIGTSAALGVPIAVASTLGYLLDALQQPVHPPAQFGLWYLPAILCIIPLSVLCAPLGVALTSRLPVLTLKRLFAGFLVIVSLDLLLA